MKLTREQMEAVRLVWERDNQGTSYLNFRRGVQPTFGMDGAIVVHWAGMWLAIETDGYTHS